ncbi:hypothetical protein Bca52824_032939 [Brassica carinata]|uniref:DUF4283 domain-containing protein n=1 Tax=Brassica carinata TaxID=52824 RepID=A0A8X7SDJ2_BRACI|nr:hypothetical protein Bca52824_032939 [Brassica carinata]
MATEPPLSIDGDSIGKGGSEIETSETSNESANLEEGVEVAKQVAGSSERALVEGVEGSGRSEEGTGRISVENEGQISLSQYRIVDGREELVAKEGVSEKGSAKEAGVEKSTYADAVNVGSGSNIAPNFEVVDGVADIEIPMEIFEDVEPLWKCFVVGYFMGDSPFIGTIHSTVNRIWSTPKSKIDVQFISKRMVLFHIEDEQTRKRVLRRKYWHIADTAHDPPDMSALPLWVDWVNVPGYLYSLEGLKFLSRTAGKFVKLHPNTERCVRMDVARVLVEVNLTKLLPQKICFKDRNQCNVTVEVIYPWLPPRCSLCDVWGHLGKDCVKPKEVHIMQREDSLEKKDMDVMGKDVVLQLMGELEKVEVRQNAGTDKMNLKLPALSSNARPSSPEASRSLTEGFRAESPYGFQEVVREVGKEGRESVEDSRETMDTSNQAGSQRGRGKSCKKPLIWFDQCKEKRLRRFCFLCQRTRPLDLMDTLLSSTRQPGQ